ncbi:hypothetical protein PENSOL_c097G08288 [Penicillium solitum]|uniref:Uncharacterized protein n=1 Tax=Penicillium solitum TaxID=60172 RepID=A0A1V6Q8R6_9EURO|nr:uncharacterized protein PENSOL_c097G08288 [Penicillium solitum]OQD85588.1 hypothetical protein PENSOL_c097G08288 [Penicillium solitum]
MHAVALDPTVLANLRDKTAVVTGAGGGIGADIVKALIANGCNVVLTDLERSRSAVELLIASLPDPSVALFIPANTLDWDQMKALFKKAKEHFGQIQVVIANAGVMESEQVLDMDKLDSNGDLVESSEYFKVLDINVKGTMNTLRQGLFYMKDNDACFPDGSLGSIVMTISTSGYFGATGNAGYISSKHALTGLLRSSQSVANKHNIRINAVSPFCTVTSMMEQFKDSWVAAGLPLNTPNMVADAIIHMAADPSQRGSNYLAAGAILRELEGPLKGLYPEWLGQDLADVMKKAGEFFLSIGGFPLPNLPAIREPVTSK